jgi:PAS domain S-box-containing protein
MLGAKDSNEILGKNVLDLIHPDFRDTVRKNIEKDLNGEITSPTELDMLRVDGTTIVAEGRGIKTTFNGKPAIQVAIRDTTERKRIEMELRESEEKYRPR